MNEDVVHIYNGRFLSHKKEQNNIIYSNMDATFCHPNTSHFFLDFVLIFPWERIYREVYYFILCHLGVVYLFIVCYLLSIISCHFSICSPLKSNTEKAIWSKLETQCSILYILSQKSSHRNSVYFWSYVCLSQLLLLLMYVICISQLMYISTIYCCITNYFQIYWIKNIIILFHLISL